jgi:amino-acid N-acetyltransferase
VVLQDLIRKARVKDVKTIKDMVNGYAREGLMLARSYSELYESIRDFYVYETDGEVMGCCALHVMWDDLAEVLSFAVKPEYRNNGIGSELLNTCLEDEHALDVGTVFTLTCIPEFFEKRGFNRVEKSSLPHKIWNGCIKCPKFPECDEIPLVRKLR